MTASQRRRLSIIAAVAAVGALLWSTRHEAARPEPDRPELLLLTSLPIAFPEEFTLDAPKSPVMAALQSRFEVVPISVADEGSLAGHRLLLMAQPQAQPGEVLVELDGWVRSGGHVLLLADPMLEWPSSRALGDPTRPPLAFVDTGLLGHWGLRLDAPDRTGPQTFTVDGQVVHSLSPGSLVPLGNSCRVIASGFVARCRIGKGKATIIADADFADVEPRREPTRSENLKLLLSELERLARDSGDSVGTQAYPQADRREQK